MTEDRPWVVECTKDKSPSPVGYYVIESSTPVHFYVCRRPNWWRRFWLKATVGITWADESPSS